MRRRNHSESERISAATARRAECVAGSGQGATGQAFEPKLVSAQARTRRPSLSPQPHGGPVLGVDGKPLSQIVGSSPPRSRFPKEGDAAEAGRALRRVAARGEQPGEPDFTRVFRKEGFAESEAAQSEVRKMAREVPPDWANPAMNAGPPYWTASHNAHDPTRSRCCAGAAMRHRPDVDAVTGTWARNGGGAVAAAMERKSKRYIQRRLTLCTAAA